MSKTMSDTQYYKIVRNLHDGFNTRRSVNIDIRNPSKYTTKYTPDEWIKAPIGGLLVFKELDAALRFMFMLDPYPTELELWECDVEEEVPLPDIRSDNMHDDSILEVWETPHRSMAHNSYAFTTGWPIGTAAFRRVKLTTLVDTKGGWS